MLITFEGIDGCGKSTQVSLLKTQLESRGHAVVSTREPGGTQLAESVRATLLTPGNAITPLAELLLFGAARAQHVQEIIRPALERGDWVLCDRYTDSSMAYQGGGLGLDRRFIAEMNRAATGGLVPRLTLLLDIEPGQARARRAQMGEDRIETRGLEFLNRVRHSYLEQAAMQPKRIAVINAAQPVETIAQEILATVLGANALI